MKRNQPTGEDAGHEGGRIPGGLLLHQPMRIMAIRQENATTRSFVLDGKLDALPGQFVMAWLPDIDEKPFGLALADPVTLTIAAVGPFSQALHDLQAGDLIWIRGPLGKGYLLPGGDHAPMRNLLIGGGYGVAPLFFLAQRLLSLKQPVAMIIGARTAHGLLFVEQIRKLGIPLQLTTEDGSQGLPGLVTDAVGPILDGEPRLASMIYACGPPGMLQAIARVGMKRRVQVQLSWEAHMRCGIGLCGSCEVGDGWLVCLDGPVFQADPTGG
ncbi:MAG: dihydroorotate dehydrogenase electron transfer subunit [Chloroflexota bacterium]|nr:dihydroorotate dehydrogenase electron transfer subunit [Chloroflexota bacterium]